VTLAIVGFVERKQELVAVGIGDADYVVTPPRGLKRYRPFDHLTAKRVNSVPVQFNEQAPFILAGRIFAQDDLASATIDLADGACAVFRVPLLLETQYVECGLQRKSYDSDRSEQ
jgi:hypothetical protein